MLILAEGIIVVLSDLEKKSVSYHERGPEFYYRHDLKTETLIKYLEDGLLEYAKVKERKDPNDND